jgi:hypothetical protein
MDSEEKFKYISAYFWTLLVLIVSAVLIILNISNSMEFGLERGLMGIIFFIELILISILNLVYFLPIKNNFIRLVTPSLISLIGMLVFFGRPFDFYGLIAIYAMAGINLFMGIFWFLRFRK